MLLELEESHSGNKAYGQVGVMLTILADILRRVLQGYPLSGALFVFGD